MQDKVAIITGAGQGIGLAYAERFLAEGAKVVVAEINEDRAATAMKQLDGLGDVTFVQTDIASRGLGRRRARRRRSTRSASSTSSSTTPRSTTTSRTSGNDYEYLQKVFQVNLHGAWVMARACAPAMVEQRWGRIINQSSGAAYMYNMTPVGDFHEVAAFSYSQTKWGVVGLTKFLASQLGQYNITVNCIAPGVTMTEATKKIVPEEYIGMIPMMSAMKQTLEPEDLAGTAVFFASDDAKLVTGQVLCVDGGACMPA